MHVSVVRKLWTGGSWVYWGSGLLYIKFWPCKEPRLALNTSKLNVFKLFLFVCDTFWLKITKEAITQMKQISGFIKFTNPNVGLWPLFWPVLPSDHTNIETGMIFIFLVGWQCGQRWPGMEKFVHNCWMKL